jgi:hypothetical protein
LSVSHLSSAAARSAAFLGPASDGSGEASAMAEETICEKGRHVNCIHTKMAAKRAAKKA